MEKLVPDTSVIIENVVSKKLGKEFNVNEIIIHEAVMAELEHQANLGKEIGKFGLDELNNLRELSKKLKFSIRYSGRRPNASEIRNASLGEVDAMIRELAYNEDAVLLTGDKVQSKVAEVKGIKVIYVEPVIKSGKLKIEKFFDKNTMSVHLRENYKPYAKRGMPGNWETVMLRDNPLKQDEVIEYSKNIIEEAKKRKEGFIEIERRGSSIVQIGSFRIVITRPPFSDAYEITCVRPIKKLNINDYELSEKLRKRIEEQAEGILIAGSPGMGKSTFASSLAEFYAGKNKTVKTIEAPRDLQLSDNITQYAISHGSSQEIHDVLLLSRPDYTIFDEMRNNEDFRLFADLRLSGIGIVGVLHATNPVDAIQRFLGRIELGVIPQVIDTVVFIKDGKVGKVLSLKMTVKVPSGMTEADLARPVIEIRDFENNKLEYELYSYGEETVVIPVQNEKKAPIKELASRQIENELQREIPGIKAELISDNRAVIYVPESEIGRIIGKKGERISEIEKRLGVSIDVQSLDESKAEIKYNLSDRGNSLIFYVSGSLTGKEVDFYGNDGFLFTARVGMKGEIKINKKSKMARRLVKMLDKNQKIILKI
ncbi:Flp pilus assembly complex ATPase component TadA [Candidatus Woesearchaeota archaeon]|nr:Flp pilus assembly complex ATPase component TadA [Candidatus Woesearchaeota archaeon]